MSKNLYIFDFDETLVTCDSYVYVLNNNKERIKKLNSHEYFLYNLNPNECMDVSEFDCVVNPQIHNSIYELLVSYKDKAVILTARTKEKPVKDYLLSLDLDIPVYAIGSVKNPKNLKLTNAKRKAKWIYNITLKEKYNFIEFWDDNSLNIEHALKIMSKISEIDFKCHLVNHKL